MGFTMIELVVVIALTLIILSIATPNLKVVNKLKESQELREFKRDILYARNQAIIEGKIYYFQLDYTDNGYFIHTEDVVKKRYYFKHGLSLIENPNLIRLEFGKSGVPIKSGTIEFKNSENKIFFIAVTPVTGQINLYD